MTNIGSNAKTTLNFKISSQNCINLVQILNGINTNLLFILYLNIVSMTTVQGCRLQ